MSIEARTYESARGFTDALSGFDAILSATGDGRYLVRVAFNGTDEELVRLFNALEQYVTSRASGPARVEYEGRSYMMHARP